ncbi:MAG: sulfatase, partial [Bacteroidales bacterium]|nr:sulfatase [Bacteroidales bacterium]
MGWQDTSLPFWTERTPYNATYHTPNMERLAHRGMMFTQAYACAISSPSRCSLITGANAARHRVTNWTMERNVSTDMGSAEFILPEWNVNGVCPVEGVERTFPATSFVSLLHDAGYHTIHCGKAHFGALTTPGEDPLNWGFDVNIAGHAAGGLATYLSEKNYGHTPDGKPYALNAIPGLEKYWGTGTFATEALTQEALAALDRHMMTTAAAETRESPSGGCLGGAPFFLYMSHYAVHIPIDRDERFYPKYIAQGLDPREAAYASLVEGMDKSLGDIMDWLDRNGQTDNTIILFMSDNGGLATQPEWRGGPLYTQNAPLSCGKGSLREGGIREPMIVSWPGTVQPGTKCDEYVMIEDFYPTLLDMAGISASHTLQPIDGRSFVPMLQGKRGTNRHRPLVWNFPNIWGNDGPGINLCCAIRQDEWKLIYHYDTGEKELYNIDADISEEHTLATAKPKVVRRLSRILGR